jgi:Acetyltransferase (GNAT) family.
MKIEKIKLNQYNIFILDDLLGDFYKEIQIYYNNLFFTSAEDLILDESSYFIYDDSKNIIGFYSLSPGNKHLLRYIYIKQQYRNKEYGTEVIKYLLYKNNYIQLTCSNKNKKAINFYNKFNNFKNIEKNEINYKLIKEYPNDTTNRWN